MLRWWWRRGVGDQKYTVSHIRPGTRLYPELEADVFHNDPDDDGSDVDLNVGAGAVLVCVAFGAVLIAASILSEAICHWLGVLP